MFLGIILNMSVPCGRQAKDIELLNCIKRYKALLSPLKAYYYEDAMESQKDFIAGLMRSFHIETRSITGQSLNGNILKQLIKKTCKKFKPDFDHVVYYD